MAWIRSNKKGSGGGGGGSNESYINTVGQAAINTGYVHTADTKIKFKAIFDTASFSSWGEFFGARRGDYGSNAFCFFSRFNEGDRYGFARTGQEISGDTISANVSSTSRPLIFVPCIFEAYGNKIEWYAIENPSEVKSIVCPNATVNGGVAPLALFTFNNATTSNGWSPDGHSPRVLLYWLEIYESDVLVHRYVPAYNNSQWCLYDEVSETYLYDIAHNGAYLRGYLAN